MKHPGRLPLVLTLLTLPLRAANQAPLEASHEQPVRVTATNILQTGSLNKVLLGYYSAAEIAQNVYVGSEFCLACHRDHAGFKDTQHAFALVQPRVQNSMVPKRGRGPSKPWRPSSCPGELPPYRPWSPWSPFLRPIPRSKPWPGR